MENTEKRGISGFTLKMVAVITMLIDHSAVALVEPILFTQDTINIFSHEIGAYNFYMIFRTIGRIAFPIYCFLLVQGYLHTRDVKKYALRLFIFALISEVPFDLALLHGRIDFGYQNVFFTLLIGLLCIWGLDIAEKKYREKNNFLRIILQLSILFSSGFIAYILKTDYSYMGVMAIALFFVMRDSKLKTMVAGLIGFFFEVNLHGVVYLSLPLIYFYDGRRGRNIKYFFYAFYPLHLTILYLISHFYFGYF